MRSSFAVGSACSLVLIAALGVTIWAVRLQRRAETEQAQWLYKESTLRSALDRAQKAASASAQAAADFEAMQARLAAVKPKPANAAGKPLDISALFLAHPELRASYLKSMRATLGQNIADDMKRFKVSNEQRDRFIELFIQHFENLFDSRGSAQTQDLASGSPAVAKMLKQEDDEYHRQQLAILGPQNAALRQLGENEAPVDAVVAAAADLALYSGTPFTWDQKNQMTDLLAQTSSSFEQDTSQKIDPSTVDWSAALAQAPSFLSPAQIAALHAQSQASALSALIKDFYAKQSAAQK